MSEAQILAIIAIVGSLLSASVAGLLARRKSKVEAAAIEQNTLSERFKDATALDTYIQERVDEAVQKATANIQKKLEDLTKESHEVHDAVRSFFTDLWVWDFQGRKGPMPLFPLMLLKKLRLEHLITNKEAAPTEKEVS